LFVLIGSLLPSEAAQCNLSELGLQFNTREKSVMHLANLAYGAGAEERVKHQIAWFSSGKDHGFNQSGRESSECASGKGSVLTLQTVRRLRVSPGLTWEASRTESLS
jgi:hypothetical protein